MSIQKKLITIIIIVCSVAAVTAGFLLWNSYALRNKAQFLIPALNYLECIAKTSAIISSQSRVASDFMVKGSADSRQKFDDYNTSADLGFQEWKRSILEQKLLNVPGESEDLENLTGIEKKYDTWRKDTGAAIDREKSKNSLNQNHEKSILPPDDNILAAIDAALEDGIEEVYSSYHSLLISMGGIPWLVMTGTEQMERAHIAIVYFVAVMKISDHFDKQLKAMMNYIQTGDADHLEKITRNGIQIEDSLSKWVESINRKNQLDGKGAGQASLPLQSVTSGYKQMQSLIDLIVHHNQSCRSCEATTLVKNDLQILLDKQLLPALSLAKADSKQAVNSVSNELIRTAKTAVWEALAAIICVTLLLSVLVYQLMKILSTSIMQLKSGIETIGNGNLDNRLNPQTTDELGSLAATLDTMTERLQQSYNENMNLKALLEKQVKQLETANREIQSFSYMLSHDMRNPVSSIICYTDLLLNEASCTLNEDTSKYLKRIQCASLRLIQLMDDTLQLSQVTHNEVVKTEFDAGRIADRIMNELIQREPDRKVDFICPQNMLVNASAQLVTILLENLLGNAWKYSSKKEQVTIEFGQFRKHGESVFFVRDNGVGFDTTSAEDIFVAFKRLHTRQEFEGTGIGLAIVQKIVQCHRGRIWYESIPDEGATFYFTLAEAG